MAEVRLGARYSCHRAGPVRSVRGHPTPRPSGKFGLPPGCDLPNDPAMPMDWVCRQSVQFTGQPGPSFASSSGSCPTDRTRVVTRSPCAALLTTHAPKHRAWFAVPDRQHLRAGNEATPSGGSALTRFHHGRMPGLVETNLAATWKLNLGD